MIIGQQIDGIEITKEMVEAIALANLYREDPTDALLKSTTQRFKKGQLQQIINAIMRDDAYETFKSDIIKVEEASLVDDNLNTIMLQYNRLLQRAQLEGKYDVAARILKEIRQIKAIENEQTKFEVIITVQKPKEANADG